MEKYQPVKGSVFYVSPAGTSAWGGFLYVHAILTRLLDQELQEKHDLSTDAMEVLFLLANAPEQRMRLSDLATATLTNATQISRQVKSLTKEGFIKREQSTQDRREYYAILTEAGLLRLREAHKTYVESLRRYFLNHFNDLEFDIMTSFWERVIPGASHRYSSIQDREWLKE
jgi:DNA-binding MarR family transcriptional regulator